MVDSVENFKKRIKVKMGEDPETEVRRQVEKIFEEKKEQLGVEAILELHFIEDAPIVGTYVYGEAFPFEEPLRVWLEVVAIDATTEEITEIVCEELVHIKYPELKHGTEELGDKIRACVATQ